jgi:transcriptional regulator with XRE-family HTH domain|nr:MAG TPA: helix-turn-helix domain protein [Caudoviricetes sp.]
MPKKSQVGARIAAERIRLGWTQQLLGEKIGVSQPAIAGYESGKREPSLDKLGQISEALGVSVARLIDVDEPPAMVRLDRDESSLVEYYRKCDEELRQHVIATARLCATRLNS